MPENMSICVNGQSRVPPGFRFHPTEEELLLYYLKKKVAYQKIDLDVICEVDLNKLEPWDIQEKCKIGSTPQNDWYFFSHKDKKYPTGTRTNRATAAGFWKATGRDKMIHSNGRRIGMRKTLVFYEGRAPHGHKSDWIMHEYRLHDGTTTAAANVPTAIDGEITQEEGWVVCRIFKKKFHHHINHHKYPGSPISSSSTLTPLNRTSTPNTIPLAADITAAATTMVDEYSPLSDEGALEQIFRKTRRETEDQPITGHRDPVMMIDRANDISPLDRSMKLPALESPNSICYQLLPHHSDDMLISIGKEVPSNEAPKPVYDPVLSDWVVFDRLVASHLNGETSKLLASFADHNVAFSTLSDGEHHGHDHAVHSISEIRPSSSNRGSLDGNHCSEVDLWSFT
ncbi:hypothetical protein Ancab_036730 [Ancistrocladus abbreviatus]